MIEQVTVGKTRAWLLWRLKREGRDVQCLVGLMPRGFQTRFVHDGRLLSEYMFDNWASAWACARQRRLELETDGWIVESQRSIH